ncbi:hypothetical protein CAI21_12600 [Alkalilimnicola ehrlichii]|uniref:Condensation domain-containing protein n=1 Tax=Alkalilimnicola ehrlichii TaxID=351052 RepID=A0A3E0X2C6_9GAMM|nr:condensation domain-containing protein [Alkalilimnicola ehrlichii]RFA28403.1 hypothetical protein CAI21_12600 [Alkalilimnicola ehrlichii]RFA38533.1 hypothetical protein CAL65_04065 [Alkalilimnicola ehrlichii]
MSASLKQRDFNNLSAAKRALLEKRLRGADKPAGDSSEARFPRITPDPENRFSPFGLTPFQLELWRARNTTGISPWFYLETKRRDLDLARFENAWRQLVNRHDMLRSVMLPDGRQKVIDLIPDCELIKEDLRSCSVEEQEARIREIRSDMLRQPKEEPIHPVEIRACRIGDNEWRLHFGFSTQIFDLASVELMAADCRAVYEGDATHGSPLPVTFRDVVLIEDDFSETMEFQRASDYWSERFRQLPEPAQFPPEARGEADAAVFEHRHLLIDVPQWQAIKNKAKANGLTDSMVVFAAFNEVLSAAIQQRHYALETRVFRRLPLHDHVYELAGQYVAGVVSEVDLRQPMSLLERGKAFEQATWRDLDNAFVDAARRWRFERGVLPAEPSVVYTSTIARFENFVQLGDEPPMKWFGEPEFVRYQSPNLGLEFFVMESRGTLECHWFANTQFVSATVVSRMAEQYQRFIKALAETDTAWHEVMQHASLPEVGACELGGAS